MHEAPSPCPDCGAPFEAADNYCRQCGMFVAALRTGLPVPAENVTRAVDVTRPGVPAPVRKAAAALAIGAALQVGVGLAGRYLAGQAAREAGRLAASAARPQPKPLRQQEIAEPEATAISETVIVRRVWVRRG